MSDRTLTAADVRALRILAQGLPAPRGAKIGAQLDRSGFQRTLGGADAYLGVRARVPKMQRGDLEALVSEAELSVIPAVRGCIYLVRRAEVALCLQIAGRLSRARDERDAERAGIRNGELDELGAAVIDQLRGSGPLTTDRLRRMLPKGVVRSLGDRGKKVGVSSTLPPTLRRLEFAGRISRMPVEGRLDHEKYEWRASDGDPLARAELPDDPTQLHALLLNGFVTRAGVTTLSAFCAWSGLTKRDAKAALGHARYEGATVDGFAEQALCTPELETLQKRVDKAREPIAFLPFEDNVIHLAGSVSAWVDPDYHDLQVPAWGNMKDGEASMRLGDAKHVRWRSILADGRICGFWDYEPEGHRIVTAIFDPPSRSICQQINEMAAAIGSFLHTEIGHGRSFSLDTDAELTRRCSMLSDLAV